MNFSLCETCIIHCEMHVRGYIQLVLYGIIPTADVLPQVEETERVGVEFVGEEPEI